MLALKHVASARTIAAGHAFVQNLRRGHDAITTDLPVQDRVPRRVRRPCSITLTGRIAGESAAGTLRLQQRNSARPAAIPRVDTASSAGCPSCFAAVITIRAWA